MSLEFADTDDNNNSYPTNSDHPQVMLNLAALRATDLQPVPLSAYLVTPEWCGLAFRRQYYDRIINRIVKSIHDDVKIPKRELSSGDENHSVVFCWDIKGITMLATNYILEFSVLRPDIDSTCLFDLLDHILSSVNFSNYEDLETENVVTIEDAVHTKTTSTKYRALWELYNDVSVGNGKSISSDLIKRCGMADQEDHLCETAKKLQQMLNQRWKCVRRSLRLVNKRCSGRKYANVVISEDGIEVAAAELMVSGQSREIPLEHVYSTFSQSKEEVLKRIKKRFGENCSMVFITTPPTELPSMDKLNGWSVRGRESLEWLYQAQRDHFLE